MLLVKTRIGPSSLHGIGLFADEFIAKGTATWVHHEHLDLSIPPEHLEHLPAPAREHLLKYTYRDMETGTYELCADDARFYNHSDDPNTAAGTTPDGDDGFVATRDIEPGEELTCDYRSFDADWRRKLGR